MNHARPIVDPEQSQWYLDHTSLLEEIRRAKHASFAPPSIAGYEQIQELQRGGQGVVYLAHQRSTKRRVAIKVLLDGAFASPTARRRFEREIDLVASLRHPNIVKIFDSGVTAPPDERPYFVMEYIEGLPLLEFIKGKDRREIIECFATICDAVNHAHQRGVIHRDLKPSNVRIDGDGRPQILDFGLAKIADQSPGGLTQAPAVSVSGQFLGSLPWASPEQAAGNPDNIDVRSDVYSLGVIMYQALTGRFPYRVEGNLRETLDSILKTDPTRPSTVDRRIDDELETIVLKCLAKEPERRYQSGGEVARDLRHYLAGEPIDAKRDSAWYTMGKTLKRYRAAAWTAALLTIVALAGLALTYWQAQVAEQQRQRAERRFNDVRNLAHTFMFDFHDQIRDLAGARPARELLVTTALQYLEQLSKEVGDDPSLQSELAAAYSRVGDIQGNPYAPNLGNTAGALETYKKALEINRRLAAAQPQDIKSQARFAKTFNQMGDVQTFSGDRKGAAESFNRAMDTLTAALRQNPNDPTLQREMAAANLKLGDVLQWSNDYDGMLRHFRAALGIIQELALADPASMNDGMNLAVCHSKIGYTLAQKKDLAGALENHRSALAGLLRLREADPANANNGRLTRSIEINHNQIGATLAAMDDPAGALESFTAALALAEGMVAIDPRDPLAASDLAYTHNKIGDLHYGTKQPARALEHYSKALEVRERLSANDPKNASFRRDLAVSCIKVADAHIAMGSDETQSTGERVRNWEQARTFCERSRDLFTQMREQGTLSQVDGQMPEEMAVAVSKCDAALAALAGKN